MPTSMTRRRLVGVTAAGVVALASALTTAGAVQASTSEDAPRAAVRGAESAAAVDGSYVVVLKDDRVNAAKGTTSAIASAYDAKVRRTFSTGLHGFSAGMSKDQAERLAADPRVSFVQQNQRFTADQDNATWGLDRTDQRDLPLDTTYTAPNTGSAVTAYVIDTGIDAAHGDFGGRASVGTDTVGDGQNGVDCHGHGSHVGGTIAGTTWGLAKQAKVVGVRVLDCAGGGTTETVVAGIDWVAANATKPAVANMSLGGPADTAIDAALKRATDAGVTFAVAAGNSGADACTASPAREPSAITVGATDDRDARASFSNFGSCVDVFAPGVGIESVAAGSGTGSTSMSGTSMASPHVAGAAVLYLNDHPAATPAEVATALTGNATAGKVTNPGAGSPNKLLFVG